MLLVYIYLRYSCHPERRLCFAIAKHNRSRRIPINRAALTTLQGILIPIKNEAFKMYEMRQVREGNDRD